MQVFARRGSAAVAAMALTVSAATGPFAVPLALTGALAFAVPALAQSAPLAETPEQRLKRMEAEIRSLQRKVFPEGAGRTFAPEITPAAPGAAPAGTPATTAVSDMLTRMDSLDTQMTRLTAQVEETQNRLALIEARLAPVASATDPAAAPADTTGAGTSVAGTSAAGTSTAGTSAGVPNGSAIASNTGAMTGGTAVAKPAAIAPASGPASGPATIPATRKPAEPSADRVTAVQAIEKPQSGDRAEDEYSYGYRLWEAKFYPEAQQQLLRYVEQFPRHRRLTYARNLLGRAYLDDGKPGTAAQYFLQNYQTDPGGDRAPDSLLYLAVSMTRLKETQRACVALAELAEKYPTAVASRLAGETARAKAGAKCN